MLKFDIISFWSCGSLKGILLLALWLPAYKGSGFSLQIGHKQFNKIQMVYKLSERYKILQTCKNSSLSWQTIISANSSSAFCLS